MKLGVVIVNYNVKYYLKQCLQSVLGANRRLADGSSLEVEVWVADNDSIDGSSAMVRQCYPSVHLIENHTNVGFARANNQALSQIEEADLLLLLNPDTVVSADTFVCCADFMQSHPDCGGLGVKMVDGNGHYLKESKRGFPTPSAAFFKISGLIHLFPHSHRIAAYYLGHLDPDTVQPIDILCGAFMMFRQEVYRTIGPLDESYFMYGEDIDYSHRILQAGYRNYYLPTTSIIHYKGESTRKGSFNYVYTFYNAMAIFVSKYYTARRAKAYSLLLHIAIWLRATLAWVERIANRIVIPLLEFALAYSGFLLLKTLWQHFNGFPPTYYPEVYTTLIVPLYILLLMGVTWLTGGYDRPIRLGRIARGMGIGLLLLLAFYSLLDEDMRYSRMLLLLGSTWTLLSTLALRLLLHRLHVKGHTLASSNQGRTLIVGSAEETSRLQALLLSLGSSAPDIETTTDPNPAHIQSLLRLNHADKVIFCGRDLNLRHIIELMAALPTRGVSYLISPADSDYAIGTDSIYSPEHLYLEELDTISTLANQRAKRTFDLTTALLALLLSPLLFWVQRRKRTYFGHCLGVLSGELTWVGYTGHRGVFTPADHYRGLAPDQLPNITLRYMRNYSVSIDLNIILRNWNNL
ncbi:MAG: glycosyltransferase family 2 protein [Bacteroidales bacterium]|nr:glycosyltransferase family 2 protein [Bacteroidales bacterium]